MTITDIADNARLADAVADLAIADPSNDLCFEYTLQRLDGALRRIHSRLAPVLDPAAGRQLERAATLLEALSSTARREVLTQPYLMHWLVRQAHRALAGDKAGLEDAMGDVGRFVALPAVREDKWPEDGLVLRARRGELRFPGFYRHVLLPAGTPDGPVTVSLAGDSELSFRASGCDIHVPLAELLGNAVPGGGSPVAQRQQLPGLPVEVDATDSFVADLFSSMNSKPPLVNYPPRDLTQVPYLDTPSLTALAEAWQLIEAAWPAAGRELRHYTRLIVPFASRSYSTFAEAEFLGAVFMGQCRHQFTDVLYTAEHLLHEHSHLRLHLIMEQEQIFEATDSRLLESPWRRDPRPAIGIVQGVFVFARVARFLRRAYQLLGDQRYAERRQHVVADVRAGLATLASAENVTITALGHALFAQCADEAELDAGDPDDDGPVSK